MISKRLVAAGFSLRFFKKTQTKVCGYQKRLPIILFGQQ